MPDTPFKSMTRDPSSRRMYDVEDAGQGVSCDQCGQLIQAGDWPWCKGDPGGHDRD